MLQVPQSFPLEGPEIGQQVLKGETLVALNLINTVVIGPVYIEGPEGCRIMPRHRMDPTVGPHVDGPPTLVVAAALVHILALGRRKQREELFSGVAERHRMRGG